jgi:hypothetical protein
MAQRLRASHSVIAEAAHSPNVERPDATATLMTRFWATLAPAD